MENNLTPNIEKKIADKYNIEAIYLFGSNLKSNSLAEDIDLALIFKNSPNLEEYFNLTALLSVYLLDKYGNEKKFDLSILNLAPPLLKYEVISNGRLIYYRDITEVAIFEIKARQEYEDYAYRSRFYEDALREHIKKR